MWPKPIDKVICQTSDYYSARYCAVWLHNREIDTQNAVNFKEWSWIDYISFCKPGCEINELHFSWLEV